MKSKFLNHRNIKTQLYSVYIWTLLFPVLLLGLISIGYLGTSHNKQYQELLDAENRKVGAVFTEITSQLFQISEVIVKDDNLEKFLNFQYYVTENYEKNMTNVDILRQNMQMSGIQSISVYTDNKHFFGNEQYKTVEGDEEWFERAISEDAPFWMSDDTELTNGNLCLIRKLNISNNHDHAVVVIELSRDYMTERLGVSQYGVGIMIDSDKLVFDYGYSDGNPGDMNKYISDGKEMVSKSEMHIPGTSSNATIYIVNREVYKRITQTLLICGLIIASAIIIPGFLVRYFATYMSTRIQALREAMHQSSRGDYRIEEYTEIMEGNDEIAEAFTDLQTMVSQIEEKEAKIYQAQINETRLENAQQAMEFQMLASQINPHFLYNTLETIRMKAFTVGDKEVASAIKLLGKSMRYVLENTGTEYTSLKKELEYVETYLAIQKLRFEDKFNSEITISKDLEPDKIEILPLLLQPIVENAILHGLEEVEKGGLIHIMVSTNPDNSRYLIAVRDNGCGIPKDKLEKLNNDIAVKNTSRNKSIGLYNINQRLILAYGPTYSIRIDSAIQAGTTVCIEIPKEITIAKK